MTIQSVSGEDEDLKCTVCGRPGRWYTPIGGAPVTDILCWRHALKNDLVRPGTYISLVFIGAILYGTWRLVSWAIDLIAG